MYIPKAKSARDVVYNLEGQIRLDQLLIPSSVPESNRPVTNVTKCRSNLYHDSSGFLCLTDV